MKSKGEKIDNLYKASKKKTKSKPQKLNKDKIDLDNEIIIGLNTSKNNAKNKPKKKTKKKKIIKKKNSKRLKIIKWTSLIILAIIAMLMFLFSELFNIKQISIINNQKISSQEIIKLSGLKTEVNMFKINKSKIINDIKTNPYVEKVQITRKLDGTILIDITERTATYMLELDNGYAYINNQGYVLEISAIKLETPIIKGISTAKENIVPGNRLQVKDLENLDVVIKIIKCASDRNISNLITHVDISDNLNYILNLENEKKTIHLGDDSNINEKVLWIEYEIKENKGVEGTLFVNNVNKPYFRNKVW